MQHKLLSHFARRTILWLMASLGFFLMTIVYSVPVIAMPSLLSTPTPSIVWNTFLGGDGYDYITDIVIDLNGNIYMTGTSDVSWGTPVRAYSLNRDIFVVKLNANGALQWHTFLGGAGNQDSRGIAVDSNGNVFVNGVGTPWDSTGQTGTNAFIIKLNTHGVLQWHTFYGNPLDSVYNTDSNDITLDGSGNVYVTGNISIGRTWVTPWGNPVRAYSGSFDIYVAKLNSNGVPQWHTFLGGNSHEYEHGHIALDSNGNIYITSSDAGSWGTPIRGFGAYSDALVAKLNANGVLQWHTFLGGAGRDFGLGMAIDSTGNIYITGYTVTGSGGNPTWGTPLYSFGSNYSNREAFVAKLNTNGILQWNTFLGDLTGSDIMDIVSSSPYIYIMNYKVMQLDETGTIQWMTPVQGNNSSTIALDRRGHLYVAGSNYGTWGSPVRPHNPGNNLDGSIYQMANIIPAPALTIPNNTVTVVDKGFSVPVQFTGNGNSIASVGFSLDYDESCLAFDESDSDGDGGYDAISGLPIGFTPSISHTVSDTDGELDIALFDSDGTISSLSDGRLLTVTLGVANACVTTDGSTRNVTVSFSNNPAATFGNPTGQDVTGVTVNGTITLRFNAVPTAISLSNTTVAENSISGTPVGALTTTDPNTGDTFTYNLVSGVGATDNASFTLDGATLKTAAVFDYETKSSYTIRIRTTDGGGRFFEQSFTITVTDVDETPVAVNDVVNPRTTIFVGGQMGRIDVLANDITTIGTLTVARVTQPPTGGGSVISNTSAVSYTAPNASGTVTFTYQATNGYATSNSANVNVNYVANHARGDCNGNGTVTAADFIAVVLEIFDTNATYQGQPAWWLGYTGSYPGSPLGCDANNSRNGPTNSSASVTAADITCAVLLFFGHPCGTSVQVAGKAQTAHLTVAEQQASPGASTTLTVTLDTGGHAIAAVAFALALDPATLHFDMTDADVDGVPDAITFNTPPGMSKSVAWNADTKHLEVVLFGISLPMPILTDGTLATMTIAVANDTTATSVPLALDLVSFSDLDGLDLPFIAQGGTLTILANKAAPSQGLFLPLIVR